MSLKKLKGFFSLLRLHDYYGKTLIITLLALSFSKTWYGLTVISLIFLINLTNNAFAFAINDLEDAEDDAKDPAKMKRNPVSAGIISQASAHLVVAIIGLLCLSLSSIFNLHTLIFSALTLTVGFLYSYKSIRLKSIPFLDLLSHGFFLGFAQFFVPAIALNLPLTPAYLIAAVMFFFLSIFGDIRNEIRDYEVDRKTKINNTIALIDLRRYERPIYFLQSLALGALIYAGSTNLSGIIKLQILVILGSGVLLYLLTPFNLRQRVISNSEPVLVAGSFLIIALITHQNIWS